MGTSLAEQLKKLKAPQTGILLQDKKRPSLLFDPKEAANLDKETVLSIGQSGLQELIKLSGLFEEYKDILFAHSSLNLERTVRDTEVNVKLDASIEKFLILLSPYFLLNTAHKALEWLIYRFRIHQFNKDQLLLLILPYHETRIFVRALQLLDLSEQTDKWHWLQPLQKPGVPLTSANLINRITSDNGFLRLLCDHVILATKVYSEKAACLSTLYAFYTTAIVGGIERASTITEVQLNHILPALVKGLGSNVADFAAGSYMIFAKLTTRVKLNTETSEKLLLKAFKHPQLYREVVLLLIFLYESPLHRLTIVPEKLVFRLVEHPWFIDTLVKIQSSRCQVSRFIVSFLRAACRVISDHLSTSRNVWDAVSEIVARVKLEDSDVDIVLTNIIKEYLSKVDTQKEINTFPVEFYRLLERKYPARFDEYLKGLMKASEKDEAAKSTLQFLATCHFGARGTKESADILDRLMHVSPEQRIMALKTLGQNDVTVPESFRETMTNALLARFGDSEVKVVESLLAFPVKRLTSLFSPDTLMDELILLLTTCHTSSRKILAKPALKILLELCEDGDDTSVFITALPYLFPTTDKDVDIAMEVLRSNFAKRNKYMQQVKKDVGENPNAEATTSAAFHNILNSALLPPTANILSAMRQQISYGDAVSMFFNMILLGSVCRVHVGTLPSQVAREVIEMATEMIQKYPQIKLVKDCNNITSNNIQAALELTSQGILPLQVGTYVLEMVHRRLDLKSRSKFDFEADPDYSHLILRLLEMFFEGINNESRSKHYKRCLQIFFQRHFTTAKDLIRFLSQLFCKPVRVQTSYHCLKISLALLNRCSSMHWAVRDASFLSNLLLSMTRENNECRTAAISIVKKLTETLNNATEPLAVLLQELSRRSSEISLDPEQLSLYLYSLLSPDPDVSGQLKSDLRKKLQQARQLLYNYIMSPESPMHVKSQLLDVLVHVNGPEIVETLTPLGLDLLEKLRNAKSHCESVRCAGKSLKNILQRFNGTTVKALNKEGVWEFFEKSIREHEIQIRIGSISQTPSAVLLRQIDETFFASIGRDIAAAMQEKILEKLVDIAAECEISSVVSSASRVIRRIRIDANLVVNELRKMKSFEKEERDEGKAKGKRRTYNRELPNPAIINSRDWKRGITLLEFVQRATNIDKEELLYPILFDLLKTGLSFEEQSPVEYTNQLLLSTIHRLATKQLPIRDAQLRIDIIAQCIRTSRNPQTHHHALLVLVELLKVVDVRHALYTIMPIFTFMGSSVVRQDDAYSIQIISKTIDTVVPIVNAANNEIHACEILRTFIVSLPDIPEHRRIPLFVKLLQLLDNHFHLYYLLTFDSHVLSGTMRVSSQKAPQQRLEFALTISREFPPQRLMPACLKLVQFLRELPIDIETESDRKAATTFPHKHVFDVANNTAKQLRHYKYTLVQFLSSLLSSPDLINRVAELHAEEVDGIRSYYDQIIVELVLLIQSTSKNGDIHQGKPIGKYWKILLHHLYDVLDLVNNLLPNEIFLISVKNLTRHSLLTVRRKALELLNARLQQKKFGEEDHADLLALIESLLRMIETSGKFENGTEVEVLQQTVLISLKLLAKSLAGEYPAVFKPILEMSTELLRTRDGPVLGSAALCVAELCTSLRTNAIQSLNKFVPAILRLLQNHCQQDVPDVIIISIVSALQKIVESVGNFLSPYLDQLLLELTRLNTLYTDVDHPKIGIVATRIKATAQKLSNCIPLRILLPAVSRTYDGLLAKRSYECIGPLMSILAESFGVVQSADLNAATTDLATFFLKVLQFREEIAITKEDATLEEDTLRPEITKNIVIVEENVSKALVALVLKLSEATFRPIYYKLYDWAARNPQFKQRNITFFRLSAKLADCLKSLFVLFAGHFLKHAAILLNSNNFAVAEEVQEMTLSDETDRIELIEAILLTLLRVFTYDAHNFVNQERFETLARPIVDQIENTVGTMDDYTNRAKNLIVPCVASFASAIPDDSLHKQLVYQTLLKTRHAKPYVRSTALNALVEIARKLGEDFMPLLPETVPFLAELLEDEDEATEKCAQEAVRTLEEILGEPLQKYF